MAPESPFSSEPGFSSDEVENRAWRQVFNVPRSGHVGNVPPRLRAEEQNGEVPFAIVRRDFVVGNRLFLLGMDVPKADLKRLTTVASSIPSNS